MFLERFTASTPDYGVHSNRYVPIRACGDWGCIEVPVREDGAAWAVALLAIGGVAGFALGAAVAPRGR